LGAARSGAEEADLGLVGLVGEVGGEFFHCGAATVNRVSDCGRAATPLAAAELFQVQNAIFHFSGFG